MNQAEVICTLFIVVAALAILAKQVALPYPVLLVIGGLALGFVPGLPAVRLEPDIVFLFLLPPLLFPAAVFTSWRDFRANLSAILLLAIGLVLLTTAFVAAVAHALTGLPWSAAFVLGELSPRRMRLQRPRSRAACASREKSSPFWMARIWSMTPRRSSPIGSQLRR